jgi:hypothetical protein
MLCGLLNAKRQYFSLAAMSSEAHTMSRVDTKSPTSCLLENHLDHGEFVDSEDEGVVEFASEDEGLYANGLLYPIRIGEILHNGR